MRFVHPTGGQRPCMSAAEASTGITCQLLFCRREEGEILVDLLALDPLPVGDDVLAPGTPLTLGLADPGEGEMADALVSLLDGWTARSSVCSLRTVPTDTGPRLCITAGADRLVIDIGGGAQLS